MVENYTKDMKESVYHGAVVSVLAVGYTMLGKTLIKMSPPSLSKFDIEDGVKLVAIVAMSDFMKDYLIKQKIIPKRAQIQWAKKRQERLDYINSEIAKEHKAEKRFMDLNSAMQQYFIVTGRQLEPLPPKPVLLHYQWLE